MHECDPTPLALERFLPDEAWYRRSPRGIHGVGHVTRVLFWADVLAAAQAGPVRLAELRWAAACHDVGRENDDEDPDHGARSGEWVLANLLAERPAADGCDLGLIAALCRCHDRACEDVDAFRLEHDILRDADALDRARFWGGDRLDPSFLRIPESHALIGPNDDLVRIPDPFAGAADILDWAERFMRDDANAAVAAARRT